jgi:hypothetical protein
MSKFPGALILMLALVPAAQARVHSVEPSQSLRLPQEQVLEGFPALAVAIDSDSLITIVDRSAPLAGRFALLYRRGADGQWAFSRTLLHTTAPVSQLRASVVMKNSIAVIDIAGQTTVWEFTGGNWVQGVTESEIPFHGGHAISGRNFLVGFPGCGEADGYVYGKATDGVWRLTGRLPPQAGTCLNGPRDVDLNYDWALINDPAGTVHVYRRNGTALDWVAAGSFPLQGQSAGRAGPLALQSGIAAAPGSTIYRRTGSAWNLAQTLLPINFAMGSGDAHRVLYRDTVVWTVEGRGDNVDFARPYAYVQNSTGRFEHAAMLNTPGNAVDLDVSARTVVTAADDFNGRSQVAVFNLPAPLLPPDGIANDFNARDISGFQVAPAGAFAIGGNSYNSLLRQSNVTVTAHAVLTDSYWSGFQSLNVELRPNYFYGADAWVGVAVRYVDAGNHLFVAFRPDRVELNQRVNNVVTTLDWAPLSPAQVQGSWQSVRFLLEDGRNLTALIGDNAGVILQAQVPSAVYGRVALLTHRTRADFDNLYATPSSRATLLYKDYRYAVGGRPFTYLGGTWVPPADDDTPKGLRQTDTSGLALAIGGAPVDDQRVRGIIRLEEFASTPAVPWFGLVARYVDPQNYYFLSVRGTNQLQIRKVVNGVTTVLAAKAFTAPVGEERTYDLQVLGNQLHALVNGQIIATALDGDLPEGRYGIATYRTAALFHLVDVEQP